MYYIQKTKITGGVNENSITWRAFTYFSQNNKVQ